VYAFLWDGIPGRQVRAGTGFFAAALATVRSVAAAGDLEAADRVESHLTDASPVVGEAALLLGADRAAVPVASDFAPVRAGVGPTAVESRSIAAPVPLPVRIGAGFRSVAVVSDFVLADAGVPRSVAVVEAVQDSAGTGSPAVELVATGQLPARDSRAKSNTSTNRKPLDANEVLS
jgi:hypothetical protein